ncbi:MAG: glycosyltransferase, partial [Deltaproteobacteria bacterium]|nr:glycosyltransferase [Deltaproteobacteria bacterium]
LLEGLAKAGCRNSLVCPQESAIEARSDPFSTVYPVPMQGDLDPRFLFSLLRIIRKERPHLVHVHSRRGADLWGGLAAKMSGTKAVITRRVDNPEAPYPARLKYGLYARIITISQGIRRVLLAEGIPEQKLVCVPSAIDPNPYQHPCEKEWFRKEFGLDSTTKVVGVIAQLIPRKGHRFLIKAAPKILESCPETVFFFFGQGPLRNQLEALCENVGLAEKISFAGFRPDLARILPCLSVVVHPATMEGLGVSLLQASAAGIPIVATTAGGIPEIVQHGQSGYLLAPGDVNGMAEAVISLLKNPGKVKEFGQAGRERVLSHFSIESMVKGNLAVYHQLKQHQSSPLHS